MKISLSLSVGLTFAILLLQYGAAYANVAPVPGSVIPYNSAAQPNQYVTLTADYSDEDGYQDINYLHFALTWNYDAKNNACYLRYNRVENKIYLYDDAGTALLGGYAPGSANLIQNSQAIVDCAGTFVSGTGNKLTIIWRISFKTAFAAPYPSPSKGIYMQCWDMANATSDAPKFGGTFRIGDSQPQALSCSPINSQCMLGVTQTFSVVYSDADGWNDLKKVSIMISIDNTNGTNDFIAGYLPQENKLYIIDDSGANQHTGLGPGQAWTLENSRAILSCQQTTVNGSGNQLTVNYSITFKEAFTGPKHIYLSGYDSQLVYMEYWKDFGTCTIMAVPEILSLTPSNGISRPGEDVTFTAVFKDLEGWNKLNTCELYIRNNLADESVQRSVSIKYNVSDNKIYLYDDNGNETGGAAPGTAAVLENSRGMLDCSRISISHPDSTTIQMSMVLRFKKGFTGPHLLRAATSINGASISTYFGGWTVIPAPLACDLDGNGVTDYVVDTGTAGIWKYMNNTDWFFLHPFSCRSLTRAALNGNVYDDLVIDFGSQYGIWVLFDNNTSQWTQIHNMSAPIIISANMDDDIRDELIMDFGAPYGSYIMPNANLRMWTPFHPIAAKSIVKAQLDTNSREDIIVDFGSLYGIFICYNNDLPLSKWVCLSSKTAEQILPAQLDSDIRDDLVVNFGAGSGIKICYNNGIGTWTQLHTIAPRLMMKADLDNNPLDELIIDFGEYPVYELYNGDSKTWKYFHPGHPFYMTAGNVQGSIIQNILMDFGSALNNWIMTGDNVNAWRRIN